MLAAHWRRYKTAAIFFGLALPIAPARAESFAYETPAASDRQAVAYRYQYPKSEGVYGTRPIA